MNRPIRSIPLQDQTARPLRVVRIVLDDDCGRNSDDDIAYPHGVGRQLFESVKRDLHFAARNEQPDPIECIAHTMPSRRPRESPVPRRSPELRSVQLPGRDA